MKKLLLTLLLVTCISVFLPKTYAMDNEDYIKAVEIVEKTNAKIDDLIAKAQEKALKTENDEEIIEKLLSVSEEITEDAILKLAELGVEAACVYVEVEIDGVIVLVDPIEVYHW